MEQMIGIQEQERQIAFSVGDTVVYRAEGVCDIVDIRKESFGANTQGEDYYILSPRNDANSSIYVPVHNDALTALMRPLLCRDEIVSLVASLREERIAWAAESRARNTVFRDILSRGERRELIPLVLTVHEQMLKTLAAGKKVGSTESGALARACKLLRDEFSVAIPLHSDEELIAFLLGKSEK